MYPRKIALLALAAFAATAASASAYAQPVAAPLPSGSKVDPKGAEPPPTGPGVSATPSNNTTPTTQGPITATSPPTRYGLFPDFGAALLAHGFDLHGLAFEHPLYNVTAGAVRGQDSNLGGFSPALDVDLGKLVGLHGTYLHVQSTIFFGKQDEPAITGQTGGFLTGFQTTPVPNGVNTILSVMTVEQRLFHDKLSIEVGRTNPYRNFLLANSLEPFANYSSTFELDGDFNSIPYPVWSGRVNYHLTPAWYLQGGVFEDNYNHAVRQSYNFGTGGSTGVRFLAEVGYRTEFNTARYPANLEAGVEINTRRGYSELKGSGAPATPLNSASPYSGGDVIYAQGLRVLWRGAQRAEGPPANVAVYGAFDAAVDRPQPVDMDAIAGVNLTGFIPGRPFDALGLQAHWQRLSAIEADRETRAETAVGGPGPVQERNGVALEAVGNVQVTPALAIRPIVEYFARPDAYYLPNQTARPHDGFEVGFFGVLSFGPLLGTSRKPF